MNRSKILRSLAAITLIAAIVFGSLATYCSWEVGSFYEGAERIDGTIVAVHRFPGGNAPMVQFVDATGQTQVEQFSPFYEAPPNAVGQFRTVIHNPAHEIQTAIDSPWNWIGPIFYGSLMAASLAVSCLLLFFASRASSPRPLQPHGA